MAQPGIYPKDSKPICHRVLDFNSLLHHRYGVKPEERVIHTMASYWHLSVRLLSVSGFSGFAEIVFLTKMTSLPLYRAPPTLADIIYCVLFVLSLSRPAPFLLASRRGGVLPPTRQGAPPLWLLHTRHKQTTETKQERGPTALPKGSQETSVN